MDNCTNCEFGIFNPTWGEYKCKKKQHYIKNPEQETDCKDHKRCSSKNETKEQ